MLKKNLVWLFSLMLISGCSHLVHLDRAQDAFNKAATLENTQRFNSAPLQSAANPAAIGQLSEQNLVAGSPEAYYNMAYTELNKSLQNKNRLEKDSVLSTALTLRALTEWKLGKYEEAVNSSDEALRRMEETGIQLPRDKAVMTALRGLVAMDLAYRASKELEKIKDGQTEAAESSNSPEQVFKEAKSLYQQRIWGEQEKEGNIQLALTRIEDARAIPGDNHPVQGYLILSQMTGLKTWGDSIALLMDLSDNAGQTDSDWLQKQYCAYETWREEIGSKLNTIAGNTESADLIRSMNFFKEPGICN